MFHRISTLRHVMLTAALLTLAAGAAGQTTRYVDDDAPNDPGPGEPLVSDPLEDGSADHPFDAIQEGIDASSNGDTVLVLDGTYMGIGNRALDFGGKAITVRSENGAGTCIIDCAESGPAFVFQTAETPESVLTGFTIVNGSGWSGAAYIRYGGGIYCNGSSPTITHCAITDSSAHYGGAIFCGPGNATIDRCVITDNEVIVYQITAAAGGGVACFDSESTIRNCLIADNHARLSGGGVFSDSGDASTVSNCLITGNTAVLGAGVHANESSLQIVNCTMIGNVASTAGGGVRVTAGSDATIVNTILSGNQAPTGPEIQVLGSADPSTLTVRYSDVHGGQAAISVNELCTLDWDDTNIDDDPALIADSTHLQATSPCRNAGDPDGDYTNQEDVDQETRVADGRVDMGVDEFVDTDSDDLPDWWELRYFGSPTAADPTADDDGDGMTNIDEYLLGCDPLDGLGPALYVDVSGDDAWDGLAPQWDGEHGPKATIQAAIDACNDPGPCGRSLVVVGDGTYTGPGNTGLDFGGRDLTVRSASGASRCIIDCAWEGRGFYFHSGETSESVVDGFTIKRGSLSGIRCSYSSPTIVNCIIVGNHSGGNGGGLLCTYSTASIANCTVVENAAEGQGGPISCSDSQLSITNCILWNNSPPSMYVVNGDPEVTYCDLQGSGGGPGNIDLDPLFTRDGMHLQGNSPCINAGDPDYVSPESVDADGEPRLAAGRIDMGADEFHDQDQDALPDWWELLHFGTPTAGEPEADVDADGLTNLEEYQQGRNPLLPPTVYYVDLQGDNDWDGLAPVWDGQHGPKATIQAAIDATQRYEGDEVVVGDGTHRAFPNSGLSFRGKCITVRSANGPADCIIDGQLHSRGFRFDEREGADSILDSITITRGTSSYGGGVYCRFSSPVITRCVITASRGLDGGGGIGCRDHSRPTITECVIADNWSDHYGGGIRCSYSSPTISNCLISSNRAVMSGGGLDCGDGTEPLVVDCVFIGNLANLHGAGIDCWQANPTIVNCKLLDNAASEYGGGINTYRSDLLIVNCVIAGNTARAGGGAHYYHYTPLMTNCTVTGNEADWYGGGVFNDSCSTVITNGILWNNLPEQLYVDGSSTPTVSHCAIQGGWQGVGNISADPLFVDPDGADNDPLTWEDNDYHLLGESPCIDAGHNQTVPEWVTTDLDGRLRFADRIPTRDTGNPGATGLPIVDMGAYEYQCDGDLNGDGGIDLTDLATLLAIYGTNADVAYADGDVDQDGDVDLSDLAELLSAYGRVCE